MAKNSLMIALIIAIATIVIIGVLLNGGHSSRFFSAKDDNLEEIGRLNEELSFFSDANNKTIRRSVSINEEFLEIKSVFSDECKKGGETTESITIKIHIPSVSEVTSRLVTRTIDGASSTFGMVVAKFDRNHGDATDQIAELRDRVLEKRVLSDSGSPTEISVDDFEEVISRAEELGVSSTIFTKCSGKRSIRIGYGVQGFSVAPGRESAAAELVRKITN